MTLVASKKRFLEFIEKQIKDDEIIVLTTNKSQMSVRKKIQAHEINFLFAADVFAKPDGVGHIAFGETIALAICICPPSDISEKALEQVKKAESEEVSSKNQSGQG